MPAELTHLDVLRRRPCSIASDKEGEEKNKNKLKSDFPTLFAVTA